MGDKMELQQANMLNIKNKPEKPRHRASVACAACRERRTRCVVPVGEDNCTQCRDAGQDCVIKHDDERRKPNSKAYVNGLRDKIQHLEALLQEKERRLAEREQDGAHLLPDVNEHNDAFDASTTDAFDFGIPQLPPSPGLAFFSHNDFAIDAHSPANSAHSNSSSTKSAMVHRLLSTKGHLSFDQLSGRLRYYGPTTNCHVYSELAAENEEHNRQALEQRRRTQRVLSTLPQDTQEYLMQMFWQYYNSVIHIIHQAAFEEGMHNGQGQFYSPFLHICILSMGYRHADKSRPDMMKIALPGKESTLHREAKYMLDYELERPGGVTSVQALLLLGDLECGVGRDNLGWLISGMANRLCFDIGLHLDNSASGLSQLEVEIGRMTLWACVIYDRYWALFLGRPTALKPGDLEVYRLAAQFERLGTLEPAGPTKNREKETYEALLDLMELAGKITEIMDKASKPNAQLDQHVYITMAALNRELETWYSRLPLSLQWTAENIEGAPFSYFLLHQQYHAAMILLHRQFAQYDDVVPGSSEQGDIGDFSQASYFATLSRMTCTRSAGRIAQIFWQHRQIYDTKKIFVTGLQHAGTAAIALIASVASPKDRVSYDTNMKYLECLAAAINDMAETYQPAERMSSVLNAVLDEFRAARPVRQYTSTVPARRGSSSHRDDDFDWNPPKRHQSTRPGVHRTTSQLPEPPSFHQPQSRRHTTTGMPPPSLPIFSAQKIATAIDQSPADFTMTADSHDASEMDGNWSKFDGTSSFMMEDSTMLPNFERATSPTPYGSTWMGAETPKFSPPPTTSASETYIPAQPEMSSNPNLDFMAILNSGIDHESNLSSRLEMVSHTEPDDLAKTPANPSAPLTSLPTPTSQTNSESPNVLKETQTGKKGLKGSRNQSRQRPSSQTRAEKTKEKGIAQTMAGLDDIWREMMRSNQNSSADTLSSKR